MAASTSPIGAKSCSANVIDIIDSDDEPDICKNVSLDKKDSGNISLATCFAEEKGKSLDNNLNVSQDMQGSGNISPATCFTEEKGNNLDRNHAGSNEEKLDICEDILFTSNTKRKRACNVVMSESESDRDDDNMNSQTTANLEADKVIDIQIPRRRLKTLRKIESQSRDDKTYQLSIPTNGDDEIEEDSLSDCKDMSNESQDESNSNAESNSGSFQDLQDNNIDSYLKDVSDRKGSGNISLSTCSAAEKGKNIDSNYDQISEENPDKSEDLLCVVSRKRKPTRNVVLSESENDDDGEDHMPISKLISNHVKETSVDEIVNVVDADADDDYDDEMPISQGIRRNKASRRRLKPLRKCVSKSHDDEVNNRQSIPTNDDVHDDDDESISQSEEGNLSGLIDDDFDVSDNSQDECDVDSDDSNNSQDLHDHRKYSNLQDIADDDMSFDDIKSKIQRKKKHKIKWEDEGDMLADFGKDPVLCMKAVCVLYRQQTAGEQMVKGTYCRNGRGFNTHDARRGSKLAEFLLDGSPDGSMNKTKKELKEFHPKGVKVYKSIAFRYSKQLFEIFNNKEDPFFP